MVERDIQKNVFKIGEAAYLFISSSSPDNTDLLGYHTTSYEYELSKADMKPEVSKWFSLTLTVKLTKSREHTSMSTRFGLTAYFEKHDILTDQIVALASKSITELSHRIQYNGTELSQGPTQSGKFYIAINGLDAHELLAVEKAFREKIVEVAQQLDRMEQPILPVVGLVRHAQDMASHTT